jgi:fatty-acid desaturase
MCKDTPLTNSTTAVGVAKTDAKEMSETTTKLPWWRRGGMHVNEIGMGLNVAVPVIVLARSEVLSQMELRIFLAVLLSNYFLALAVHQMRTVFCVIATPTYLTSLLLCFTLKNMNPFLAVGLAVVISVLKVGVCMSVCLHRYMAHAAFKCGPITRFFVNVVGCAANQGGPIWWASQHRCHHKYCDLPRDPHAPVQVGTERAFSFFQDRPKVEEEFVPKHSDTPLLRVLDTFSFSVCMAEMTAAYYFMGREGLFVSYTASWICQTITLWFNIANHPLDKPGDCKASNTKAKPDVYYPAFLLLDMLYSTFAFFVGEDNHLDHHKYMNLAKRGDTDYAYYISILPMEALGLVWNVKMLAD